MLDNHQNEAGDVPDQPGSVPGGDVIVGTYGLRKLYGDFAAVDDIDLRVHAGEVFGLSGPNGAGKGTTIKMLVTLLPPTEERATVGGYDGGAGVYGPHRCGKPPGQPILRRHDPKAGDWANADPPPQSAFP